MAHKLTDSEWDELVELIAASPTERMGEALKRMAVEHPSLNRPVRERLKSAEQWFLHLASISSGTEFDRALLTELRRLSVH